MREPNFSSPTQNKAAVVISSTLYDRRALDCTATLPLVNSLTHLAYMTSTSPRIREILASDGGLERLVKILATCNNTDKHSLWKWSLAFQCVVNIGVRGTEAIRTRVVDVGAVQVVLAVLENFLRALELAKMEKEQERSKSTQDGITIDESVIIPSRYLNTIIDPVANTTPANTNSPHQTALSLPSLPLPPPSRSTPVNAVSNRQLFGAFPTNESANSSFQSSPTNHPSSSLFSSASSSSSVTSPRALPMSGIPFAPPKRRTFLSHPVRSKPRHKNTCLSSIPLLNSLGPDAILHREEDILLSLQLLAYLSKYPHIRQTFHKNHQHNVFSVVEKFTHRIHPQTIIYWAGVIMRNACRKDESRGGIRQCAYMHCGKWERYPREFAKCRRCRKAKYCSKPCQSRAWAEGHRWWCVERTQSASHPPNTISTTTAAATAAVVAAAPPPVNPMATTDQMGALDDNTTTTHIPMNLDETSPPQQQQLLHPDQAHHQRLEEMQQDQPSAPSDGMDDTEEEDQRQHRHRSHHHHHHHRTLSPSQQQRLRQPLQQIGFRPMLPATSPLATSSSLTHADPPNDDSPTDSTATTPIHNNPPNHATTSDTLSDRSLPSQQSLLYYPRRRRHSRSVQSLASGSSTEVEVDMQDTPQRTQVEMMDID
ncbi:hypothetical protein DM01DRAFT_1337222 [Hesseltinella vesiculosa]|uniref:MYND-type domain-containing protein n=1 Tax=Hesseltinella vesiculosa TaxID=101127 RepID=A0A1X2GEB4_9FUNG|nr:hypothetical protein DM01DRAFT_1337222 [Hesseltinella vesiculosa]